MTGAGRKLGVSHGRQFPPQGLPAHRYTERLPYPLRQIRQSPPDDTVDGRHRATFDNLHQRLEVRAIEEDAPARRLLVNQADRAFGVEPQHPIPDDLKTDAANTRSAAA